MGQWPTNLILILVSVKLLKTIDNLSIPMCLALIMFISLSLGETHQNLLLLCMVCLSNIFVRTGRPTVWMILTETISVFFFFFDRDHALVLL